VAVVGDEEVLETVVVVIADANAVRPAWIGDAGFGGDIGEGAVAVVAVEAIAGTGRSAIEATPTDNEDIHPSVIVVIEEGAAAAHGFVDVSDLAGNSVDDRLGESRLCSNIGELRKRR
jgi:hypothetical protein